MIFNGVSKQVHTVKQATDGRSHSVTKWTVERDCRPLGLYVINQASTNNILVTCRAQPVNKVWLIN